ncbi:MAG: DUF222 domain-containing protein [Acidimicrobiia bacterium]
MFDSLPKQLRRLTVPATAEGIVAARQLVEAAEANVAAAVAEFDATKAWADDGARSMATWLTSTCTMSARDATRCVAEAEVISKNPAVLDAWASGELSGAQVAVIAANVAGDRRATFDATQLSGLNVRDTRAVVQRWAANDGASPSARRGCWLTRHDDGSGRLVADLSPDDLALVDATLANAVSFDRELSVSTMHADALVAALGFYLDHHEHPSTKRNRPHVNILIDAGGASYADGTVASDSAVRRYLCDAAIHRVIVDGASGVLDYGHEVRSAPAHLFNALVLRDRRCLFPGCEMSAGYCDAHHIVAWEDGGPTSIENLGLLCRRHHMTVHTTGWEFKRLPDGTVEVTTPDGRMLRKPPP